MSKKKESGKGMLRAARRETPAHGGSSWKVAYADFVTAMMAFFLLMWILNMVPKDVQRQLEVIFKPEVAGTFQDPTGYNAPLVVKPEQATKLTDEQSVRFAVAQRVKKIVMDDPLLQNAGGLASDDVGVLLRVNNDALFKRSEASLTAEGERVVKQVVEIMRTYNMNLVVRGHADKSEVSTAKFASAWELSGARASAALRAVLEEGRILPTRARAVAYADTRPLLPPTSDANRAANRRVEFYFHRPEIMSYQVVY